MKTAHLTTVDLSLRYLLLPQLEAARDWGECVGISAPGPYVDELQARNIRHRALLASTRGMNPLADLRSAVQLWRILREERPDILHTHNPKPGLYGRVVGRLAGVPIVVNTVHGLYATPDDPWPRRLVVYLLEAIASRFSDAELVQNPEDLELLRRLRISTPSKLRLLGNGVDLTRFTPERAADTREVVRAELGAEDDQVVVGMVGRLVAEKGYPELFEAVTGLDDRYLVVVVGPDDPDKPDALPRELIAQAEQRGIRFLGMRTDVDQLYGGFDVFVLPSHREGFPRAAMEAAASGLPVVATDIRGCRQVVEHEVNGLLVPARNPEALAAALRRLGDEPELRSRMGNASAIRAREHFDEAKVVERVMSTYREVAGKKGLAWRLPRSGADVLLRPADKADVAAIASLHRHGIETGFLSTLGERFLRHLYRALVDSRLGAVIVAESDGKVVGFVAGAADTGAFYREFLRRRALLASLSVFPAALRPSVLKRVWETLRYGTGESAPGSELLAMVVAPAMRRTGLGRRLVDALQIEAREQGWAGMRVVVGAHNRGAIALYRSRGFGEDRSLEVHGGEPSLQLTWRP